MTTLVNWGEAPRWAQWAAVDPDGRITWATREPLPLAADDTRWVFHSGTAHRGNYCNLNGIDWRETLHQRPKVQA